jgi:[ribosomal protein S5]-alanine N-acetyltransferase
MLRPVTRDDAAAIFNGYASSPTATKFMVWPRSTAPDPAGVAERSEQGWATGSAYPWAVILQSTGEFLGVIELRLNPPKADLGYIFCVLRAVLGPGICERGRQMRGRLGVRAA